jgi:hypothetical protein
MMVAGVRLSPNGATYPWATHIVTFCFPALLQLQSFYDAWISFDEMVQADDSWPILGFMLLPAKELPVAIFMRDQAYGSAPVEHMAAHECSTFAIQDQLRVVASELTFLWSNPFGIQFLGPFLAIASSA